MFTEHIVELIILKGKWFCSIEAENVRRSWIIILIEPTSKDVLTTTDMKFSNSLVPNVVVNKLFISACPISFEMLGVTKELSGEIFKVDHPEHCLDYFSHPFRLLEQLTIAALLQDFFNLVIFLFPRVGEDDHFS